MLNINVKEMLEAGVHFGHRTSRWNPKMRPYIYGRRNLIHIIDIKETVRGLMRAQQYLKKVASQGSLIVFVGTKRQAAEPVMEAAAASGMPYVSERWLGGMLTNFRTIRGRLKRLEELETQIVAQIAQLTATEPWETFSRLDRILEQIASRGVERLAWQGRRE